MEPPFTLNVTARSELRMKFVASVVSPVAPLTVEVTTPPFKFKVAAPAPDVRKLISCPANVFEILIAPPAVVTAADDNDGAVMFSGSVGQTIPLSMLTTVAAASVVSPLSDSNMMLGERTATDAPLLTVTIWFALKMMEPEQH